MRNKYNCNELVQVTGIGKQFGKVEKQLGFIVRKDDFFEDYYIYLIFGEKEKNKEKSIKRILGKRKNKTERYQIRLCTTKKGYDLIKNNIKTKEPISNNKFDKLNIYRKFERDGNIYIIIGWKSVYWPVSNKSIIILENTIRKKKNLNIPFQYIVLNEDVLTDIKIIEFSDTDQNVRVFSIERKIKTKKLK